MAQKSICEIIYDLVKIFIDMIINYNGTVYNSLGNILQFIYYKAHKWFKARECLTSNSLEHWQQSSDMAQDISCQIICGLVRIFMDVMVNYDETVHNSLGDILQFIYGRVHRWSEVK